MFQVNKRRADAGWPVNAGWNLCTSGCNFELLLGFVDSPQRPLNVTRLDSHLTQKQLNPTDRW